MVDQLTRLEIPFVLIETNEGLCRELLNNGVLVIQGDAKRQDVLVQAGIQRACGICIVIDSDAETLHHGHCEIAERQGEDHYTRRPAALRQCDTHLRGDEVIIPEYEGGLMTGRMIQKFYPTHGNLESAATRFLTIGVYQEQRGRLGGDLPLSCQLLVFLS